MKDSKDKYNIVLKVAYDGTQYYGWQKANKGPSIEHELEKVLEKIFQEPLTLQAASRTDRGVHADAQIVNFFCSKKPHDFTRLRLSLNQLLPSDIRVFDARLAPHASFHPTLDAKGKIYEYRIANTDVLHPFHVRTHWHIPQPLDIDALRHASTALIGTHDFVCFQNWRKGQKEGDTIRTIYSLDIIEKQECLLFHIYGDNFLYKMVRNIVGTLIYVGLGKIHKSDVQAIIRGKNRVDAGITAPAHGLSLHKIFY